MLFVEIRKIFSGVFVEIRKIYLGVFVEIRKIYLSVFVGIRKICSLQEGVGRLVSRWQCLPSGTSTLGAPEATVLWWTVSRVVNLFCAAFKKFYYFCNY